MRKTITIAAYNRPSNFQLLIDSLREQLLPIDDYSIVVSVDGGGDKFEDVLAIAESIDGAQVFAQEKNLGLNNNTFWVMDYAFSTLGATHNVYLEDDLILSPDAFNLVEWYIECQDELKADVDDIGVYCLCNLYGYGEPDKVFLSELLSGWGFLMDAHQWERFAKPVWLDSRKTWDLSIDSHIRVLEGKIFNAFPELSRVSNTGRNGTTLTPERFDAIMAGHKYNEGREAYQFQFVGIK